MITANCRMSKEKKLRIFFNSNAPWSQSGYGQQMAEILPRIVKEGYPVAACDFFGLEGGKLFIDGVLHYPKIAHVYGSDALLHHAEDFKSDVQFTLQDIYLSIFCSCTYSYYIFLCPYQWKIFKCFAL